MGARTGGSFRVWPGPQRMRRVEAPPAARPAPLQPSRSNVAVRAALRRVATEFAHCLACDKRPDSVQDYSEAADDMVRIVAHCHGALDYVRIDGDALRRLGHDDLGVLLNGVADRLARLFPHDSSPDMKELLRYNREGGT